MTRARRRRKNDNRAALKQMIFIQITERCKESVFETAHANQHVDNDNENEICSGAERDPMVDEVYDEGAESKVIGGERSAGYRDHAVYLLDSRCTRISGFHGRMTIKHDIGRQV